MPSGPAEPRRTIDERNQKLQKYTPRDFGLRDYDYGEVTPIQKLDFGSEYSRLREATPINFDLSSRLEEMLAQNFSRCYLRDL